MATLKQRLYRKHPDGGYDPIHLETSADIVRMPDGIGTVNNNVAALKAAVNNLNTNPYALDTDTIKVGDIVSWAGYSWRVVHKDITTMYMATNEALFTMHYGTMDADYKKSRVYKAIQLFESALPTAALNLLDYTDVEGTKSKAFIPETGMLTLYAAGYTGFQYFTTDARRIAYYNGNAVSWWTASRTIPASSGAMIVTAAGKCNASAGCVDNSTNNGYYTTCGFRPFVAYRL